MKIKTKFISNSSAASFVVIWKCKFDDLSIEEMLRNLLHYDHREDKLVKELTSCTFPIPDSDDYKTIFGTCMMNCYGDFGKIAEAFVFALTCAQSKPQKSYEIIQIKILEDH